jgi:chromosome segregation ATPase
MGRERVNDWKDIGPLSGLAALGAGAITLLVRMFSATSLEAHRHRAEERAMGRIEKQLTEALTREREVRAENHQLRNDLDAQYRRNHLTELKCQELQLQYEQLLDQVRDLRHGRSHRAAQPEQREEIRDQLHDIRQRQGGDDNGDPPLRAIDDET